MILKDIIDIIESVAPLSYQEEWDNSGMQVGNPSTEINAVLLTTDVTESVVVEAVSKGCNLIISHHPLLFHGLKNVCGQNVPARCVVMAIQHNIAIYSSHTTMDSYVHGVSGLMAQTLGIKEYKILVPGPNATQEHPYGLGVIGDLDTPIDYEKFLQLVKQSFGARYVRYTPACTINNKVQRIAMCGGAGAEFLANAIEQHADVYLTADCKYHEMQESVGQIAMVDIDHWTSERGVRELFKQLIGDKVTTYISENDNTPICSI